MQNQALGLAEAIARLAPADVVIKRVKWRPVFDRLPSALKVPWMLDPSSDAVEPDPGARWPDVWIGTGRATLPLSAAVKRRSAGRTFVVQTQDPRWRTDDFDLVVAPEHDGLSGPNVVSIIGSPHRVTATRLVSEAAAFPQLAALPRPRVAVLVGGRSRAHDLPEAHAGRLAGRIAAAIGTAGGSAMVTFSRRTPDAAKAAMTAALTALPGTIWDGSGKNPYFAFLHFADHVIVTEDSANMAAEAASTGRPVHVLPMTAVKAAPKFERLHGALRSHGATRPFDGRLDAWSYPPLDETARAAREIVARLA
ncbi:MAG TPA: mitochondrial fission ELM1 family protein [Brevundimonas sp.]|jgi:mitochondrial fission protein ELM1|uniref:mitochondrial fission ELM1 family protein n=1 Tax=Brevundimonas sp. TaxID=1871086 RepID=UPI002DE2A31A|nr:mitochondrial fission ELM1 family protein [Brevundimonas sp.]